VTPAPDVLRPSPINSHAMRPQSGGPARGTKPVGAVIVDPWQITPAWPRNVFVGAPELLGTARRKRDWLDRPPEAAGENEASEVGAVCRIYPRIIGATTCERERIDRKDNEQRDHRHSDHQRPDPNARESHASSPGIGFPPNLPGSASRSRVALGSHGRGVIANQRLRTSPSIAHALPAPVIGKKLVSIGMPLS
jgi:hypothetical protein